MGDEQRGSYLKIEGTTGGVTPGSYGEGSACHVVVPFRVTSPTMEQASEAAMLAGIAAGKAAETVPDVEQVGSEIEAGFALVTNFGSCLAHLSPEDRRVLFDGLPVETLGALVAWLSGMDNER